MTVREMGRGLHGKSTSGWEGGARQLKSGGKMSTVARI